MLRNGITLLLLLILVAVTADILVRSRPVHAQSSQTVYIDAVHGLKNAKDMTIRGTQVIGFSCSEPLTCYVLSK